jgi:methionyl-tRNA formyltransferase
MDKVKTLFIGTGEFAIPILNELHTNPNFDLVGAVTQPDKPVGREQVLTPGPVKQHIDSANIEVPVIQPTKINERVDEIISKFSPELIIVASYGQIISKKLLDYPKHGSLNFHGSLLPKLRGAVPIQCSILLGFKETGVTLQLMSEEMDMGAIVSQEKINISDDDTYETLSKKLSKIASEIVKNDLVKWVKGEIVQREQDHSLATYCYQADTSKDKAEINAAMSVEMADRMVRAFYPWPVAWILLKEGRNKGKRLKIFSAKVMEGLMSDAQLSVKEGKLVLSLSDGALELIEVQLEGKERRNASEYLWLLE